MTYLSDHRKGDVHVSVLGGLVDERFELAHALPERERLIHVVSHELRQHASTDVLTLHDGAAGKGIGMDSRPDRSVFRHLVRFAVALEFTACPRTQVFGTCFASKHDALA